MSARGLVNEDYSINPHEYFTFQERKFKIVSSDGENKIVSETIDTVKNLESGRLTKITRQKLKNYEIINWVYSERVEQFTRKSKKSNR